MIALKLFLSNPTLHGHDPEKIMPIVYAKTSINTNELA